MLTLANTTGRPVQVGSHFHLAETNAALAFDGRAALGRRLDTPAETAVRSSRASSRKVRLSAYGGARLVYGFNRVVIEPYPIAAVSAMVDHANHHGMNDHDEER